MNEQWGILLNDMVLLPRASINESGSALVRRAGGAPECLVSCDQYCIYHNSASIYATSHLTRQKLFKNGKIWNKYSKKMPQNYKQFAQFFFDQPQINPGSAPDAFVHTGRDMVHAQADFARPCVYAHMRTHRWNQCELKYAAMDFSTQRNSSTTFLLNTNLES
jgi:hypothetical protein